MPRLADCDYGQLGDTAADPRAAVYFCLRAARYDRADAVRQAYGTQRPDIDSGRLPEQRALRYFELRRMSGCSPREALEMAYYGVSAEVALAGRVACAATTSGIEAA